MSDPRVIVPLRSLENHVYCARQCTLIHGDGIWVHNEHTARGIARHRRVDAGKPTTERSKRVLRSIPLWSESYGLAGRSDVVELIGDDVVPVEHKAGSRHGDAADVQLCGQALCLEEMLGVAINHGFVWYGGPRRRHRVELDTALRARTIDLIAQVRHNIQSGKLPPAPNDERCSQCQLNTICLPEIVGDLSEAHQNRFQAATESELFSCAT